MDSDQTLGDTTLEDTTLEDTTDEDTTLEDRTDDHRARAVPVQGAVNMRDVGGLPVAGGGSVRSGVLLRSDNLHDLTDADVQLLTDRYGVRRVVDLRTSSERESMGKTPLERLGTDHRYLTLIAEDVWRSSERLAALPDADRAQVLADRMGDRAGWLSTETPLVGLYLGYLADCPDNAVAAVRAVAEPEGATIVHCAAGKDRTGVVVALALAAVGVPDEVVVADYAASADNIQAIVNRLARTDVYTSVDPAQAQAHAPQAATLQAWLGELQREHGGAAGWLRRAGMSDDELERLAGRLVRR